MMPEQLDIRNQKYEPWAILHIVARTHSKQIIDINAKIKSMEPFRKHKERTSVTLGYAGISQVQNQKLDEENTNGCDIIKVKNFCSLKNHS